MLASAATVQAQSPCPRGTHEKFSFFGYLHCEPDTSKWMKILRISAIGAATEDIVTTGMVLHQGGRETNPILRSPGTLAKAVAIDAGMLAGIHALEAKRPMLAKLLYVGVIATRGFATVHNARQIR